MTCEELIKRLVTCKKIEDCSVTEKVYMIRHVKGCAKCLRFFTAINEEAKKDPDYKSFVPTEEEREKILKSMATDPEL